MNPAVSRTVVPPMRGLDLRSLTTYLREAADAAAWGVEMSKLGAFVGLILTGGPLVVPAHAETTLWEGKCTSLVRAGQQSVIGQVNFCNPVVAREVSGGSGAQRVSFTFSMQGGNLVLTFSGPLQEGRAGETPIDQVTETVGPAYVLNSPASGTCHMALPEIVCTAVTARGPYEGRFLANPGPPKINPGGASK